MSSMARYNSDSPPSARAQPGRVIRRRNKQPTRRRKTAHVKSEQEREVNYIKNASLFVKQPSKPWLTVASPQVGERDDVGVNSEQTHQPNLCGKQSVSMSTFS